MKATLAALLILSAAFTNFIHADDSPPKRTSMEQRLRQIDEEIEIKLYERLATELSEAILQHAMIEEKDSEPKTRLEKKVNFLVQQLDQIRSRAKAFDQKY